MVQNIDELIAVEPNPNYCMAPMDRRLSFRISSLAFSFPAFAASMLYGGTIDLTAITQGLYHHMIRKDQEKKGQTSISIGLLNCVLDRRCACQATTSSRSSTVRCFEQNCWSAHSSQTVISSNCRGASRKQHQVSVVFGSNYNKLSYSRDGARRPCKPYVVKN